MADLTPGKAGGSKRYQFPDSLFDQLKLVIAEITKDNLAMVNSVAKNMHIRPCERVATKERSLVPIVFFVSLVAFVVH